MLKRIYVSVHDESSSPEYKQKKTSSRNPALRKKNFKSLSSIVLPRPPRTRASMSIPLSTPNHPGCRFVTHQGSVVYFFCRLRCWAIGAVRTLSDALVTPQPQPPRARAHDTLPNFLFPFIPVPTFLSLIQGPSYSSEVESV